MARLEDLPIYEQEHLLSKLLPPLGKLEWVKHEKHISEMKFAIITTAGLTYKDDDNFNFIDASYRAIPKETQSEDILMTHSSVNFDKTGFQEDINVVFPIDRFKELEEKGLIGSLADINYSFMGAGLLPDAYEDSVKDLSIILKQDHIDAVIVLPVCPNCSRTVCAITHYLEAAGIMTAGITLFKEIAESMMPPRSLWVTFPLGRPLGKPNDSDFQHKVISDVLSMLKKNSGPVLNECKLNANDKSVLPPACPINFNTNKDDLSWHSRLKKEIASLVTWYDLSIQRRGRTTFGVSNSSITEIADGLTLWIDNKDNQIPDYAWIKLALDDIKIYYSESLIAKPSNYPAGYVDHIIFNDTVLGELLSFYYKYFTNNPNTKHFGRMIASREMLKKSTGNWAITKEGTFNKKP